MESAVLVVLAVSVVFCGERDVGRFESSFSVFLNRAEDLHRR